jgi:hypothetical protein
MADSDGQMMVEIRKRAQIAESDYVNPPVPSGRLEVRAAATYQRRSAAPARCGYCGEYCPAGSATARRCLACGIPFEHQ